MSNFKSARSVLVVKGLKFQTLGGFGYIHLLNFLVIHLLRRDSPGCLHGTTFQTKDSPKSEKINLERFPWPNSPSKAGKLNRSGDLEENKISWLNLTRNLFDYL